MSKEIFQERRLRIPRKRPSADQYREWRASLSDPQFAGNRSLSLMTGQGVSVPGRCTALSPSYALSPGLRPEQRDYLAPVPDNLNEIGTLSNPIERHDFSEALETTSTCGHGTGNLR